MSPQDRLLPASPFTAPRPGPGRGRVCDHLLFATSEDQTTLQEYPPVPEPMRSPERIPAPIEDIHRSSVSSAGRPELVSFPSSMSLPSTDIRLNDFRLSNGRLLVQLTIMQHCLLDREGTLTLSARTVAPVWYVA